MDGIAHTLKDLEASMFREAEKLEKMAVAEDSLRACVLDRDWLRLDEIIRSVKTLSHEIAETEKIRSRLYQEARSRIGAAPDEGFYEFLARLPENLRGGLADLHRRLKTAVGRVQGLSGGIDAYIRSTLNTMGKILEELYPSRRLRMYTRTGAARGADHPLVVSHSL
jgi:hypothetical protein